MVLSENNNTYEGYEWLSWKISPEGTFLTVVQEFVPNGWNINEIKSVLIKNKVKEFDLAKIEEVIKNSSGQEELIGPPFELFDEGKRRFIRLQVAPIQVRFSIDTSLWESKYRITKDDVSFLLAEKSVVYGIDYGTIDEILTNEIYGQEFIIASATPPTDGKDAVLKEIIPIDPNAMPFLNEDGSVDYKKWYNISQVRKGEVICTRTPPTDGIPGISVFGHPLSPTSGEDYALPVGINTQTIENETKLVATIDGFLYRQDRNICVGGVYIVKDDVNFKTGNIEYSGDVLIKGNVNAGFSVVADGNVSIEGFVEAACIESKKGSIFLKGSVFGQNKAKIIAEKNITAENIQDVEIKSGKTLIVNKHIRNCKIETEYLEMPKEGQIIGSTVYFRKRLRCGKVGGKTESVNEFIFVENEREKFKEELQKMNEFLQKLSKAIEALQAKIFLIKPPDITPELENQKNILTSQLSSCETSRNQLVEKRKNLIKLIEFMPDKDALITIQSLSPILKLSIFGVNRELRQELSKFKLSWRGGHIKMESI